MVNVCTSQTKNGKGNLFSKLTTLITETKRTRKRQCEQFKIISNFSVCTSSLQSLRSVQKDEKTEDDRQEASCYFFAKITADRSTKTKIEQKSSGRLDRREIAGANRRESSMDETDLWNISRSDQTREIPENFR